VRDLAAVRGGKRISDRDAISNHSVDGERFALQSSGQRLALDVLHDHVVDPAVLADVVQRANAGMVEARNGTRLPLESPAPVGVG
jgi:hypothetical protein